MISLLKRLMTPAMTKSKKAADRQVRLGLETLEGREVPAAIVSPLTPVLDHGMLTVVGNGNANTIAVTRTGNTISVLGRSFAASAVSSIVISGEGGNDTISVSESITVPTHLYGGYGVDHIYGGGGADSIYGGLNGDFLYGRRGADTLYGGQGADLLSGGDGSDFAINATRADTLRSVTEGLGESPTQSAPTGFAADFVNEVRRLVNAARAGLGLRALTANAALHSVAFDHSGVQSDAGLMGHVLSNDVVPTLAARLDANHLTYTGHAENVAKTTGSFTGRALAARVMQMWMNSPGHRANILNPNMVHIGIGVSGNATSGYYMTQVFTKP